MNFILLLFNVITEEKVQKYLRMTHVALKTNKNNRHEDHKKNINNRLHKYNFEDLRQLSRCKINIMDSVFIVEITMRA